MRFVEIDVFGIYVALISVVLLVGWITISGMRRVAARFGLLRHAWRPALFVFADYVIVLSAWCSLSRIEATHVRNRSPSEIRN